MVKTETKEKQNVILKVCLVVRMCAGNARAKRSESQLQNTFELDQFTFEISSSRFEAPLIIAFSLQTIQQYMLHILLDYLSC
jgi:5-formaminoimidazole-4-carboxamide-1-beta-D-ribofuranosyl 5'-monophosphate synthetase